MRRLSIRNDGERDIHRDIRSRSLTSHDPSLVDTTQRRLSKSNREQQVSKIARLRSINIHCDYLDSYSWCILPFVSPRFLLGIPIPEPVNDSREALTRIDNENINPGSAGRRVIIELSGKNKESGHDAEHRRARGRGTLLFRASFTRDSAAKSTLWSFHGNYVLILRQNTAPIVRNP